MTKIVALVGYPLKHSISPFFQQAAFDYYHLDIRYEKWEIELSQLETTINRLRKLPFIGTNITIPYKEMVMHMLDEIDDVAVQIGAVNTIVNRDSKLFGYNTDAPAFMRALHQDGNFESRGKNVVLLGAGGAARAVGFVLIREGVRHITIINRTLERANELATSLRGETRSDTKISILPWEDLRSSKALSRCDLLVNCTSIGMKHTAMEGKSHLEAELIPKGALVCDLVYNPAETPLMREAKKAGAKVLGGLSMLVYQGAASFELWTDKKAPLDIMFKRAREMINEKV